jgi:hypothetical protein
MSRRLSGTGAAANSSRSAEVHLPMNVALRRFLKRRDFTRCCVGDEFLPQSWLRKILCYPVADSLVKFVLEEPERQESIYIEQIPHGNSDKISATCLLVKTGASGPPLRTGRPVMGSRRIFTSCERVLRGVNTIRPPSTLASSWSPVRSPSLRRIGLGRTTWPLVETLVCTVRQSYHILTLPKIRRTLYESEWNT